jgi:hypothetical protein
MAKNPDNPVDSTRDGSYSIQGPTVSVGGVPGEPPARPAPATVWRQVGEPVVTGIEPAPGT